MSLHNLDHLFRPSSVAVVGASRTPGRVGSVVMRNLMEGGFEGPVMPVNPKYQSVAGVLAYPDVASLPIVPDLAVICTPPAAVPGIAARLAERGTRAAVVLTAGLHRERDERNRPCDQALLEICRPHGLRVLGPNCVGMLAPHLGLNASFAHQPALPGRMAFVSQSGAICTAVLDWARSRAIGFSYFVSLGDSLDVDFGDVIDYIGGDPMTRAILLYIESVQHARKFLSAARASSRNKPIVAIKAGRVEEGERAAASHTRALAGSDDVYEYALRRAGVLRVTELDELFDAVETLERGGAVGGSRLAILTNGGGPGVMATDALIAGGGRLATLSDQTMARLDDVLPPNWSRANPVDIIGDAPAERFARALEIIAQDESVDAVLVLYAPTAVAPSADVARAVIDVAKSLGRPLLTSWLGGASIRSASALFTEERVATYDTPGHAVRAFLHMVRHRASGELLMQTPPSMPDEFRAAPERGRRIVHEALAQGREWLSAPEATSLLSAYGIRGVESGTARDPEEAAARAAELGFPVALKILSPDVLHKTDVGGVALDLGTREAVAEAAAAMRSRLLELRPGASLGGFSVQRMARLPNAQELLVGAAVDPIFGPFVLFGQGGIAVEILRDRAVALPPLNLALALELVGRTRVSALLEGYRGRPAADHDAIARALVGVSQLLIDLPEVIELDVNPLLADPDGVLALDARVRVAASAATGSSRLAIRPYPTELEEECVLPPDRRVLLRPIRPEDEPQHLELFRSLTPEDVRFRFFHHVRELPHTELARYTQIDYDREMAFVAIDLSDVDRRELGVIRAIQSPSNREAEFAVVVRSDVAGHGVGRRLLEKMIDYCRGRSTTTLIGFVQPDNRRMLHLAESMGFDRDFKEREGHVEVRLDLTR